MSLVVEAECAPLSTDSDGVVRIGGTRVTLDTIVAAFREGLTPEGIAEQYPSLRLADIYSAIGYFLNHTADVEAYLRQRRQIAETVRAETETRVDPIGIRQRLLARQARNWSSRTMWRR